MKKIVTHLIVFILFLIHYSTFAQKQNNQWQFGNSKINFNTNPPSVVASPPYYDPDGYYLMSSVADRNTGKLLFHGTRSQVWNANNQKMSNGDMLKDSSGRLVMVPLGSVYDFSPFVIVPKPGSSSLYYIITKSDFYNYDDSTHFSGIFYSVVDMTLNGGLGDVVLGQKNRLLFQTKGEGPAMAVIPASDGLSFWLIGSDTADALFSLKIDSKGFQATPVRYKIGVNFSDNPSVYDLKINRQFNKLAFGDVGRINILDFNNTTGVISNLISWQQYTTNGGLLSTEFSPNGKVLYVSDFLSLVQYDISKTTGVAIQNSAVVLEDITPGTGEHNGILQLASNNKIYCNRGKFLSGVNCPNKLGAACGFQPTAISLDKSSWEFYSLPPWVYYASDAPALISNSIAYSDSCFGRATQFFIKDTTGILNVTWNFGDSASGASNTAVGLTAKHIFSKVGNYTVRAIISNACGVDTLFLNTVAIINCVPITGFNIIGDTCNVATKFTFKPIETTTADSLIWTFDDPNSGANSYISFPANPNALHTFSAAGIYKVCLFLQEPGFPLATVCKTVNIGQCCNGIITTKDSCRQNSIPFSIINDSTITSVTWNFGDSASGASNTAVGLTANHVFSKVGNYTVRAIVSNACGVDTLFLNRVTIINCVPITGFNIIGDTCNVATKFTFKPIGTTTADSLIWTFDDPNSGANSYISFPANPNALHTFSAAGIYKVCLILQEPGFPLATVCKTVNIGQCCNGIITTKDSCLQNSIPFSIINDSTITSVTWNFGDSASGASNTSTSLTPTHLFSAIGTYNIRSIINSSCGIDTLFKTLAITSCDSTIDVCELSIANVFTPNGDGINDKFYPLTKCTTEQYEFFIYNRWGQLVYKTTNQTDKWDGKYREEDCSEGVYMYLIRYKYPTQPAKNVYGSISLLR
jgi:gliding motility-associated-like protein